MINIITSGDVVIDNTTLSNFSLAGVFDLLNDIFHGAKIITISVKTESFVITSVKQDVELALKSGWLEIKELYGIDMLSEYYTISKNYPTKISNVPKLGDGEAASLIYAKYQKCILITDDNGPKKLARKYGIVTIGSIGLLYMAKEMGLISLERCDELFNLMRNNGAFFPKKYRSFSDCISDLEFKFMTVEKR
ncbi:hypothetical protein [Paenibacillus assamensis]|uniref:hypothetical protein n=1 Tax=Paenibacillus assamensis TaxID=311244 RepID=UPI00048F8203|nr:hypothetical protein [Paenibacillus assamensis]